MNTSKLSPLVLSLSLLAAACASSETKPAAAPPAASSAPAEAAPAAPALSEPLATATTRVRGLLESVDDAKIAGAFSKEFLAAIPPAKIKEMFTQLHQALGTCGSQRATDVKNGVEATVRITCEHGELDAKMAVRASSPFLLDGLKVNVVGL